MNVNHAGNEFFVSSINPFITFLSSPHTEKIFVLNFFLRHRKKGFFNYISFVILLIAFNSSSYHIATPLFLARKKWHRAPSDVNQKYIQYRKIISGLFTPGLELLESERKRKKNETFYLREQIFMTVELRGGNAF